jgi:DNA primase
MNQLSNRALSLSELASLPHTVSTGGNEWRMCCPLHGGSNPTAFCLSLTSGLYHCFACGVGGRLQEFWQGQARPTSTTPEPEKKAYSTSKRPLSVKLKAKYELRLKEEEIRQRAEAQLEIENGSPHTEVQTRMRLAQTRLALAGKALANGSDGREAQRVLNYLHHRGISFETTLRAGVGYEPHFSFTLNEKVVGPGKTRRFHQPDASPGRISAPALLFPLYDPTTGAFLNFYARGISLSGLRLHHVGRGRKGLFNAQVVKLSAANHRPIQELEPLIVVEGAFDALAWLQAGYQRVVALIGTSLIQPEWFRGAGRIILAFDNDQAGRLAQKKAAQSLTRLQLPYYNLNPQFYQDSKDFADLWKAEVSRRDRLCKLVQTLRHSHFPNYFQS